MSSQATQRGIWVSNIPSEGTGNALSCAEMAIYLTLACLRSAHACAESIAQRRVGVPLGRTLFGTTVLIVGFGGIAKELVPRCTSFILSCPAPSPPGAFKSFRSMIQHTSAQQQNAINPFMTGKPA